MTSNLTTRNNGKMQLYMIKHNMCISLNMIACCFKSDENYFNLFQDESTFTKMRFLNDGDLYCDETTRI